MWWLLLIFLAGSLWFLQRMKHSFWSRRGVPSLSPHPLFGNMKDVILLRKTEPEVVDEIYRKTSSLPYLGVYHMWRPQLLIRDPELIKTVLIGQFDSFPNHPEMSSLKDTDAIAWSLVLMRDQEWKHRRALINPLFTPRRLKGMFNDIHDNCHKMLSILDEACGGDVELESVVRRYAINVTTSTLFGMDTDSLDNANSVFVRSGAGFGKPSLWYSLKTVLFYQAPELCKALGMKCFDPKLWDFFHSFVKDVVQHRENKNQIGDDLIGVLIKAKNHPELHNNLSVKFDQKVTLEEITGHVFTFFDAGYDTTTVTTCFCLYELSLNKGIQEKVRREVEIVVKEDNDHLTYEGIQRMVYLDQVIRETLRKYPPAGVLRRQCGEECVISGTDLKIPKGMHIMIPISALHYDPQYFPDPRRFDPERGSKFSPQVNKTIQLLSFGKGPRMCIGHKLAELEMKLAVAMLVLRYDFSKSENMVEPLQYDPNSPFITCRPKHGIWAVVNKRIL